MKRLIHVLLSSAMLAWLITPAVHAEPDYTDTEYWQAKCSTVYYDIETQTACRAYNDYMVKNNADIAREYEEVQAKLQEKSEDIEKYAEELAKIQEEIDAASARIVDLTGQIKELEAKIDVKKEEIKQKEADIAANEADVDEIHRKMDRRVEVEQWTMRTNKYVDIIMGAESFEELLRLLAGFQAIAEYDSSTMDDLENLIALLNTQREELEFAKAELEAENQRVEDARTKQRIERTTLLSNQAALDKAKEKAELERAALEEQGTKLLANIADNNTLMNEISLSAAYREIGGVVSDGWTFPVPGSYRSAGTWYYASGGVHLGYDFAAPVGTSIVAAGNGVIINSANGCPTYGYLGSSCGGAYGGSSGGGNQVYLLTAVNDGLYAVKYCHLQLDSPIPTGSVVSAGDIVGRVGSSGNSSGAHCHIEVMYLGDAANMTAYMRTWNGDLSFGCGWYYAALSRRCESGVGAPCRVRPETVFGG